MQQSIIESATVDRHGAALILACSANTITRLIRAGRIKAGDVGTGRNHHYRIAVEELRRYQEATALASLPAPRRRGRRKAVPSLA